MKMISRIKVLVYTFLAATLLTGLVACADSDDAIEQNTLDIPKTYTLTVEAGKGSDATRALSLGGADGKTLNATWAVGEEVKVYHVTNPDTYEENESQYPVATLYAQSEGVTTTLSGRFVDTFTPVAGQVLRLKFNESPNYTSASQGGTLDYIATHCDYATAKITVKEVKAMPEITYGAGAYVVTPTAPAQFENQQAIVKFSLYKGNGTTPLMTNNLTVTVKKTIYTVTSDAPASEFFVAVKEASSKPVTLSTTVNDVTYTYEKASVSFEKGKYYAINVIPRRIITTADTNVTLYDGDVVSGTGGANTRLFIADNATVKLAGVTNNSFTGEMYDSNQRYAAGIECNGNATIILADGTTNTFTGHWDRAAVYIHAGNTLTIRGSGILIADNTTNEANGAGIGGSYQNDCGNILIGGGTIIAKGSQGAGIGSGSNGHSCGNIIINGGTITATGGSNGAGIGSGNDGSCGAISIDGSAIVTATGANNAAGIGCGGLSWDRYIANTCGDITISGSAHVTATGGDYAAGIGSGCACQAANTCGDITIEGSADVTAMGGDRAAGIGSGNVNSYSDNPSVSSCGAISITGGTVSAMGGNYAAGIGSGSYGKFASIHITGGITSVTATRSNNSSNVPIGKGNNDQGSGSITIDGQAISDNMTKGTADLPTFPNLNVAISNGYNSDDGNFSNGTWIITKQ